MPFGDQIDEITETTAKKVIESQIKDFVLNNAPLLPAIANPYSTTEKLPNGDFKPDLKNQPEIKYNVNGEMLLQPGDYTIPVMTFCLRHNASSPGGYIYTLNQLQGKSAKIIKQLNLKALSKYKTYELQNLIWSILAGLSYSEMDKQSQKIIDEIVPEYKADLEKSYYQQLRDKWNKVATKSQGIIPDFQHVTHDYLSQLGSAGAAIVEVKDLHDKILSLKDNYESLRSSISTRKVQQKEKNTPWSKISDRIYARFVTSKSFNEVGTLQVRVIAEKRQTSTVQKAVVAVDMSSVIADPNNNGVQPLALFPLFAFGGVAIESAAVNPYAAAAVMAAILAAETIDWNAFFDLANRMAGSLDQSVKDMIKRGNEMLNKKYDEGETELRENKIISGKDIPKSEQKSGKPTRQYEKTGDDKTLQEDFDKLPGDKKDLGNGKEYKEMPSGRKAVKRPSEKGNSPTLEIQPPMGSEGTVKLRYK